MSPQFTTRAGRRAVTACALAALLSLGVLAGCGSSDETPSAANGATAAGSTTAGSTTTGGDGGAGAAQAVAAASKPIAGWDGFGDPVSVERGKRIVAIECSALGVGCVQGGRAVEEAAKALGWSADVVDGKGDPTVWNAAIHNAIASKADGIVLLAISPDLVKDGVASARAAGIPVVAALVGPRADGLVATDPQEGGEIMASFLADDSGGKADVLVLNDAEFALTDVRNRAMVASLGEQCPDCKTKTADFTFATMPQELSGQVTAALQADPAIDYVVAPFDAAVAFVRQGVQQAGRPVKIASFEGDPPTMRQVGDGTLVADLAAPNTWVGWQAVDDLARLLARAPVGETPVPQRLFTSENKADAAGWDGDVDFRSEYRRRWGVG